MNSQSPDELIYDEIHRRAMHVVHAHGTKDYSLIGEEFYRYASNGLILKRTKNTLEVTLRLSPSYTATVLREQSGRRYHIEPPNMEWIAVTLTKLRELMVLDDLADV